jgi:hypothetical protein
MRTQLTRSSTVITKQGRSEKEDIYLLKYAQYYG